MEFGREEDYKTRDGIVTCPYGIHARPSALVVKTACSFDREICLAKLDENSQPFEERYNCKNVMSMMNMEAKVGTRLRLYVRGIDSVAEEICEEMAKLAFSDFGESYIEN